MAFSRNAARLGWLLIGPLALQPALLATALDAAAKGLDRSAASLLTQAPGPANAGIPKEVQGWADGAAAAYTRGDPAAALRLQRRVLAWTQANRPALDVFRARAFINLGTFLNAVGQQQQALAPTEEAVRILRQLEGSQHDARPFLAMALNNLGKFLGDLGRHQEALAPTKEAVQLYHQLAKANPSAALPLLRETVSTEVSYLQGQLPLLPEARRLELLAVFGDGWQLPFSQAQQGEAGGALALFTRLNRQGLLQDIQRNQALLARSGPQQQSQLLARKEQLEQELYRQLPQVQPRLVEAAQIAALLPTGSVLVEFQRYRSHDGSTDQFGPPRYLALLLRP